MADSDFNSFLADCVSEDHTEDPVALYHVALVAMPRNREEEVVVRGYLSAGFPTKEQAHERLYLTDELPWDTFDGHVAWMSEEAFGANRRMASLDFSYTITNAEGETVADRHLCIIVTAIHQSAIQS